MGKFSGILICSDFDGTVADEGIFIEKNLEALEYFKANGGIFTIVSGRTMEFIRETLASYVSDGPVAAYNGTLICNLSDGKIIRETFTDNSMIEPFLIHAKETKHPYTFALPCHDKIYWLMSTDDNFLQKAEELIRTKDIYKLAMRREIPFTKEELERIIDLFGDKYDCVRSSPFGIEIQGIAMNKGIAARYLAELLGAHTLVCMGDFENDISMIKEADIGYAVGNALPSVKAVADRITVNHTDGALAAVIKDLENELK